MYELFISYFYLKTIKITKPLKKRLFEKFQLDSSINSQRPLFLGLNSKIRLGDQQSNFRPILEIGGFIV